MPEGFHPFPSRTRKLRPPGPMILGAQAPGKVGHRQVTNEKTISCEVVFSVLSYTVIWSGGSTRSSTLQEFSLQVAMWRKAHPVYVSRTRKLRIHIAGVFVISRNVAKGSSAFRPPGPMILGAQAPGKVGHRQVNKQNAISYEVAFLC